MKRPQGLKRALPRKLQPRKLLQLPQGTLGVCWGGAQHVQRGFDVDIGILKMDQKWVLESLHPDPTELSQYR